VKILDSIDSETTMLIIEMAYNFGFRIGEIANLKKSRVKSDGKTHLVALKIGDTKTRKARQVPINDRVFKKLKKQMADSKGSYVFTQIRGESALDTQTITRWWHKALRCAGIRRRLRFHDLRHTCATNYANMELSPLKACTVLGMSLKIYEDVYVKKSELDFSSFSNIDLLGANPSE
jgi:integrase